MQVTPGSRLGPYEIVAPIGAGGMGEVYKARDTRLDRRVAIKIYMAHGGSLMSVDMTSETATPVPLFQVPGATYDVTHDGQRFLVDKPLDDNYRSPLTFVSN
jgi:serine/threonine protein kinase